MQHQLHGREQQDDKLVCQVSDDLLCALQYLEDILEMCERTKLSHLLHIGLCKGSQKIFVINKNKELGDCQLQFRQH